MGLSGTENMQYVGGGQSIMKKESWKRDALLGIEGIKAGAGFCVLVIGWGIHLFLM